jgi:hypothetical protein
VTQSVQSECILDEFLPGHKEVEKCNLDNMLTLRRRQLQATGTTRLRKLDAMVTEPLRVSYTSTKASMR